MSCSMEILKSHLKNLKDCNEKEDDQHSYLIMLALSKTITLLDDICTKHNSINSEMNITSVLQEYEVCKIMNTLVNSSDEFIKYLSIKLLRKLFDQHGNIFNEKSLKGLFDVKNIANVECINELLKVVLKKAKNGCQEKFKSHFDLVQCSVNIAESLLRKLIADYFNVAIEHILNLISNIILLLKIYLKIKDNSCEKISGSFCLLITAFQDLIIQMLTSNKLPDHCVKESQLIWLYLSKGLLQLAHIASNQDKTVASVCYNILKVFTTSDRLNNVVIIESTFVGADLTFAGSNHHLNLMHLIVMNECSARKMILFQLKVLHIHYCAKHKEDETYMWLAKMFTWLNKFPNMQKNKHNQIKSLLEVFMDQDNELIETMLLILQLYIETNQSQAVSTYVESPEIMNPFCVFYELIKSLSFDDSILLDWLVSNESKFFEYFQCFLDFTFDNFDLFIKVLQKDDKNPVANVESVIKKVVEPDFGKLNLMSNEKKMMTLVQYSSSEDESGDDVIESNLQECSENLDMTMSCLIRLRLKLERLLLQRILPENVGSIITKLESIEALYEK